MAGGEGGGELQPAIVPVPWEAAEVLPHLYHSSTGQSCNSGGRTATESEGQLVARAETASRTGGQTLPLGAGRRAPVL